MTPNVPLLIKTLEHIEAHPEDWKQFNWACGTAGCFAWHAAVLDGAAVPDPNLPEYVAAEPGDDPADVTAGEIHVSDRAERVLGLDPAAADELFDAANTMNDLRRIVGELTDRRTP